ncbi:21436_t:CDS:2 [Cetraspora pellucida]|uniref:21436_t:CDS:1 n=1 Tax=Cetraspora pellucida TaxID=1433469 RepID=A0A9N9D8W7_9GLOM|nr:21436_t:CDS:2 [Cetraspora pellucida]
MFFQTIASFITVDYLLIIFLTLFSYLIRFYYNHFTRPNPLPGPLPLPFDLENFFYGNNFKLIASNLQQKYGDICEFRLGGYRRILLSRTDYFDNLLTSSTKSSTLFAKHEYTHGMDELGVFGKGMFFNSNYETWKINRYLFSQSISTPGFNDEVIKQTNDLFNELDGYWNSLKNSNSSNDADSWFEMDFLPWISRFSSDILFPLAIGERAYSMASYYNSFNSNENSCFDTSKLYYSDKFNSGIVNLIRGMIIFQLVNPFLRRHLPILKDKVNAVLAYRDFIFKSLDNIIEKRKIDLAKTPQKFKSKHDLLTFLLTTHNDANEIPINDDVIRPILLDAFLAGSDTTANLLCYIIYYICHNPHVKQKMFDEIDSAFPNDSSDIPYMNTDIIAKLKYCEAIIKETSRVMPVTAVSRRVAVNECEVAGYTWPAKTIFHLNYASIHLNEKYWENPNVYNPDRFYQKNNLNEFETDLDSIAKYSLVIFGGGTRICPGRKLAIINMLSFMALMFKKYDVELVDMQAPLNTYTTFMTTCQDIIVLLHLKYFLLCAKIYR